MSELDAGVTLTPEENAYFESGGTTSPVAEEVQKPEVQAEPEKVEQGKEKVTGKEQEADKAEKVVPLAALHEERGKRKELEKRARDFELELTRFRERFRIIDEVGKKAPVEPPDPNVDPIAALRHSADELKALKAQQAERDQREAEAQQSQRVVSTYAQDAQRFKTEAPDFDDAYAHAVNARVQMYRAIGHQSPEEAAKADELRLVMFALEQGKSPAEAVYEIAKSFGYQKKEAAKEDTSKADKIDTIKRGQDANKSLSSAGGSSGADEMTADALLKMPMDEFEAWVNKNPAKAKRLMGG